MAKTNIDNFAKEVVDMMKQYTEGVSEGLSKEIKRLGEEGAEQLQDVMYPKGIASDKGTPAEPSKRRVWEIYAQNWFSKFEEGTNYANATIHNKKAGLTHLLEFGHATRHGTYTRAFPHIEPMNEKLQKQLEENTIKIIERGGK